ncbi:galectin-4-like [Dendropsophus ebraccatus]|uniref:galectin-4-like n=1 Tax=Dendropsophus ebraccatus TaxID=150705 RepID=UPI0038318D75
MTYEPTMSYKALLHASFGPTGSLLVMGSIPNEADKFHVNLVDSKTKNIHLHVNPRFLEGEMVRNTLTDDTWGAEEKETPTMPLQPGQNFMMLIRNEGSSYGVYINGTKAFDYTHRLSFGDVDMIEVGGDVAVTCIQF